MNSFIISNFVADSTYMYQIYLHLPEAKTINRANISNLAAYSPIDEESPRNKIMNFPDGTFHEGWLNFYFIRYSNQACYIFSFGLNKGIEIAANSYIGEYQAFADVLNKLTGKLNKAVEDSKDEFRRLYALGDTDGIKSLVSKIIQLK